MNKNKGRDEAKKYSRIIEIIAFLFRVLGRRANVILLNSSRNLTGKLGLLLRYVFLKNSAKSVGLNVSIQPGVFLFSVDSLEIGNNVSIHPMCYIEACGGISIGNDVSIAHSSTLISTNHTWDDLDIPIKYNPVTYGPIILQNDIWIGCGVRILSGVTIYDRAIVAAGAVVSKNVESKTIVGGVPAKVIKQINS